jgi:hydrogenase maturation factor
MLKPGKLPVEILKNCIQMSGACDPRVVIGPRFGEDCAVIDLGNWYLVTKTDPVTFTSKEIGWYAVNINANDVAVMGAKPLWFQACLLFPVGTVENTVREVFAQIDAACKELDIAVTGGHTEVTAAVSQPVVVGDMHGLVEKNQLVTSSGAQSGDIVALTKAVGIEGTGILAAEKREELKDKIPQVLLTEACALRKTPGISVVREALVAAQYGVTAMHDPTEGGVAMGLYEMAEASQGLFTIDLEKIPILPSTAALCHHFGLNPLGLISSGTLLLTVAEKNWPNLAKALQNRGVTVTPVGVVRPGKGIVAFSAGKRVPFVFSEADELTKVL